VPRTTATPAKVNASQGSVPNGNLRIRVAVAMDPAKPATIPTAISQAAGWLNCSKTEPHQSL
jgi:hypothetical protein